MFRRYAALCLGSLALTLGVDSFLAWVPNKGLPLVYVMQDRGVGTLYVAGCVGRAFAYFVLGAGVLAIARVSRVGPRDRGLVPSATVLAGLSWIYWFVVDPTALTHFLSTQAWDKYLVNLQRHAPVWAELYTGWGYVLYFWWLVGIHWGLVVLTVAAIGCAFPDPANDREIVLQRR